MQKSILTYVPFVIVLTAVASVWVSLLYYSPNELIGFIGIENAYAIVFTLSFVSGLSVFGTVPYHLVLIALVLGGVPPVFLGLSAAIGVTLGDSTSYLLGYQGRAVVPSWIEPKLQQVSHFLLSRTRLLPVYIFLYGCFVPFSNDFVGVSLGLVRYPFWRVIIPLFLGNVVFNIGIGYLSLAASDTVMAWLLS